MHRQFSLNKISRLSLLFGYLMTVVFSWTLLLATPTTYAAEIDELCIPPLTSIAGNRYQPSGSWLTIRVINRATFEITMTPGNATCTSPAGLNLNSISADDTGTFASLISGIAVDGELDNNFDYRLGIGGNSGDDTLIENFSTYPSSRSIDGNRILALGGTELTDFFRNVELKIGIEEDAVPNTECSLNNANLAFEINDNTPEWDCISNSSARVRGINILSVIQDIENFNVVYTVSEDGLGLNIVSPNSPGEDSFIWCGSPASDVAANQVFRNGSCTGGNLEIRGGVTPQSLIADADNPRIELNIVDKDNASNNGISYAAGSNTEQGQPTSSQVGLGVDRDESCEANGGAFAFVVCPALEFADGAIATLDGRIFDALYIGEENYSDSNLRESWARIRNVGYALLIPVMLIMVISTALGFSFVDAYTAKRAIPRMFAAIIFMALSFDLCIIAINVVNGVGQGTAGLITSPFGGLENLQLTDIFSPSGLDNGLIIGAGIGFVAVGYVGIGILMSYLFVGALVLLAVFVLLALRRVLVVALILLAPLAIISWIFPGNDKLWKLWYNSFTKLLYLFPIIIALLATGRVFASITQDSADGIFGTIIKLTAFVGPYFLIPTAFKFAGGAFGNLAGMANDRSKGVFDRQRKKRAEMRQKGFADFKAGERGPKINKAIGEKFGAFSEAESKGKFLGSSGYRKEAMSQQRKLNEMRYGKTERAQATQEDDGQQQALTYSSAADARANMGLDFGSSDADVERAIFAAEATGGFSKQRQSFAARQLAKTGTGYKNQDQMQATVARVSNSSSESADLLGEINAVTKGANRHDLAAGYGNQVIAQTNLQNRIDAAGGYNAYRQQKITAAGGEANYRANNAAGRANFLTGAEQTELHAQAGADIDAVTYARQKPGAVSNMSTALNSMYQAAEASGGSYTNSQGEVMTTAALAGHIEKIEQAGSYASLTNTEVAGTELITPTAGIDPATGRIATAPKVVTGLDSTGRQNVAAAPTSGRAAVKAQASPTQLTVNPVTGDLQTINTYRREASTIDPVTGAVVPGAVVQVGDPATGKAKKVRNRSQDIGTETVYKRHNTSQPIDPNNINFQ